MSSYDLDFFDAVNDLNDNYPGIEAYIHTGAFGVRDIRSKTDRSMIIRLIDDGIDIEWHLIRGNDVTFGRSASEAMNNFLAEM